MQIVTNFLKKNDRYKMGRTMTPTGIVVHSTAVNQKNIEAFTTPWNAPGVKKCVHAFIGLWKGEFKVVQTLPWNYKCWGCGSGPKGSYNNNYIQFEICEDNLQGKDWFTSIYETAAELCAYLAKKYNIGISNIVCHSEAHARGYASNHADVMHWFPKYGTNMDKFRSLVREKMKGRVFKPSNALTRGQAVTFLYRLAGSPSVSGSMPFEDVKSNRYYYNAVLWASKKKITSGITATSFGPGKNCTRASFLTMLYRYAGSPAVEGENKFKDVKTSDYFYNAVQWAVKKGITSGTSSNMFSPGKACSRVHALTFLYKYSGNPSPKGYSPFTDVSPTDYFYKPVLWAYEKGITAGG